MATKHGRLPYGEADQWLETLSRRDGRSPHPPAQRITSQGSHPRESRLYFQARPMKPKQAPGRLLPGSESHWCLPSLPHRSMQRMTSDLLSAPEPKAAFGNESTWKSVPREISGPYFRLSSRSELAPQIFCNLRPLHLGKSGRFQSLLGDPAEGTLPPSDGGREMDLRKPQIQFCQSPG
ncbi:Hypothetical predicted protein [Podarcis lilfordi]|nr:Hypothetical predicted protein [Podarcis lilfordi]